MFDLPPAISVLWSSYCVLFGKGNSKSLSRPEDTGEHRSSQGRAWPFATSLEHPGAGPAFLPHPTLPPGPPQEGSVRRAMLMALNTGNQEQLSCSPWASPRALSLTQPQCWDIGHSTGFWYGWITQSTFTTIINPGLSISAIEIFC